MIDYGKFTGEMHEGYVEIQMPTEILYARPVFAFPLIATITEEWLAEYKDNFLAVVDYIRDASEKPLLVGLMAIPDKNFPEEGEKNYFIITKKFRAWINDADNKFIVDALDNGEILLGNKDVTEPVLLGDKWKSLMDDLLDALAQLTVVSPVGTTSVPVNVASFQAIKAQLQTILSQKVKTI